MKIAVFGPPGAGKTTLCRRLADTHGIPVYHLDKYYMLAGWKKRELSEFLKDYHTILSKEEWIIDGNGRRTLEERFKHANLIIYCHPNMWRCYHKAIYRAYANRNTVKTDGPDGAKDSVSWFLIRCIWQFEKKYTTLVHSLTKKYPKTPFIELTSHKAIATFDLPTYLTE